MNSKSVIVFSQPPLHCTILLLLRYYYYHVTHIIKNQILYVQNSLDPLCKMTTNNQFATCLDSKTRHTTRAGVRARAGGWAGETLIYQNGRATVLITHKQARVMGVFYQNIDYFLRHITSHGFSFLT